LTLPVSGTNLLLFIGFLPVRRLKIKQKLEFAALVRVSRDRPLWPITALSLAHCYYNSFHFQPL
jgi:hypothetical protein